MSHPLCYTTSMKMKMKLTKKEAKFLADALTKWAEVTAIEINDIEIRVHGVYEDSENLKAFYKREGWSHSDNSSTGSMALYRKPFDVSKAFEYHHKRAKKAEQNLAKYIKEGE